MIKQKEILLKPYPKGFHLITQEIVKQIVDFPENGLLHIFIKHTSAGLLINENADPSVREDLEYVFNRLIPENDPRYTHVIEGSDDMPAHIKLALTGHSLTIPVTKGKLNMGIWQGIYLCEFRKNADSRSLVLTLYY